MEKCFLKILFLRNFIILLLFIIDFLPQIHVFEKDVNFKFALQLVTKEL